MKLLLDLADLFCVSVQGDDIHDFKMGSSSIIYKWNALSNVLESLYKMRTQESEHLRTVLAMYQPENWSTSIETKLSEGENHGEETHWSNDQNTKLQGQKWKDWNRSIV